jgi:modification methylase
MDTMAKKTRTSDFGVSNRESHDSSLFYNSRLYQSVNGADDQTPQAATSSPDTGSWVDQIYCHSSEDMTVIPSNSVALVFTSPPYNASKQYDHDLTLEEYLGLIAHVSQEVYRVLCPGGRFLINVANLGRTPYIPLTAHFYHIQQEIGFLPMGEIIWQKGRGASGSFAWGSWMSAKSPRLRDLHEYILVFSKMLFSRPERGNSDISRDEFMEATLSVWNIPPESAKKVGHPAPFPLALASRVIRLYSYTGDVILDPFNGSGTTCVAAKASGRHFVGFDISLEYCQLAENRLRNVLDSASKTVDGD